MSQQIKTRKITKRLVLYTPHSKQLEFHNSTKRYRVCAFGRQSGKSTACVNELLKRAWEHEGQTLWFISPTYDQAKIQYRRTVGQLWSCPDIMIKKNQTELRIKLINQSQIIFKSGETFDNLRGETLHGCVIDEVREQHRDLWPLVIRPMLATTKGWAAFVSTPNGFDQFYDLYEHARLFPAEWDYFSAPSSCNPLIDEKELESAKSTMSEAQFAQEYLAEFRDLTAGKAYITFSELNIRDTNPFSSEGVLHDGLPVILAPDFNLNPMAWGLGQKRIDDFYFFDEIYLENSHTPEASRILCERIKGLTAVKNHGIIICGDATAKAGQRAAAGQSDYDILFQMLDSYKIKWQNRTPESNPLVKDRVNTMNAKFKDANGLAHMWIHPKCKHMIKDFQRVVWKVGSSGAVLDQVTDRTLTHSSDGPGYAVHALSPLTYDQGVPTMKVIMR